MRTVSRDCNAHLKLQSKSPPTGSGAYNLGRGDRMRTPRQQGPPGAATPGFLPRLRRSILVIDDEPMIRAMLSSAWPDDDVEDFELPRLALDRANIVIFDVVFCDLNMPSMTGLDVHHELVQRGRLGGSGFVLMTGHHLEEAFLSDLAVRGVRFLQKPFGLSDLFVMFAESGPVS
jgi:CheY-like chemotaxis protein